MSMKRGAFIVIEGVDRCGKTSQSFKLIESLKQRNIEAERIAFPDRTTKTGQIISKYLSDKTCKLNDQAIHLLFSANRWENVENIKELLHKGITLIVDRYSYSGIAFSCAKGMDMNWCSQPEIGLPKPDLVLFLNIKPDTQNSRSGFGIERYETTTIQAKVAKIFNHFAHTRSNWNIVDANQTFDKVHSDLLFTIENKINNIIQTNAPLEYFTAMNEKENQFNGINIIERQ